MAFHFPEVMIDLIRNSGAKIVVIALGGPKQELFMEQCRNAGLTGFFMGVGGTFDVFRLQNELQRRSVILG